MASRLVLRIQERYAKLTAGEQKIAQLVLEREDDILIHSATEIAEMAGVSKATTARFFQHLGYADFNEVKLQAREERNRTEPFEYSSTVDEEVPLVRTISAHLDLEIANITRTFEALRSDKMREAAELIAEAPRVWVIGLGDEEGFARYARLLFSRLRHSVMLLGINQGSWAEDLAMTGPKDVLLLITLPPHRALLKQILGYAVTSRLNIVTITDRGSVFEAQRYARVVLPCHVDSIGLGASYTAVSSAIRLLALTYASYAGKSAQQRLEIVAGIHDELDDMD
ncbi:MurR/RpiR family transcriptional regulator [Ochrobactrum sp. WV_118_8]|jgi:DNA-binding MurR/RpiR family transcriptional regulator|uniref:MurR/RpiR family transcriptional regulator n=1 Tax=Brucella anthropi TaxID=529 RepID=A0A011UGH6_BRUAN|nr:MurR/RpiR family transcriptional regulator [Brucella anthropi]MCR5941346.1 MurR/RpiR family transcriptional regulator [Ochrobactrum sp. XJ1]EXL05271.1 RpiR family transcriptional regulator [Brucella anthropi]KAB2735945.1 MurR/RpiR family transcriptional regulator [Brucella anthropi]KAB2749030.1 MurR/RpiR family transcriptional regulator [Brucella anthropi]KAB2770828.1 MurR/RpiR family transcriptional regulator [Brucella anthropi]